MDENSWYEKDDAKRKTGFGYDERGEWRRVPAWKIDHQETIERDSSGLGYQEGGIVGKTNEGMQSLVWSQILVSVFFRMERP